MDNYTFWHNLGYKSDFYIFGKGNIKIIRRTYTWSILDIDSKIKEYYLKGDFILDEHMNVHLLSIGTGASYMDKLNAHKYLIP